MLLLRHTQERVKLLELERAKALNELAATRSELKAFSELHQQLEHENTILEKITKINREKTETSSSALKGYLAAESAANAAANAATRNAMLRAVTQDDSDSDDLLDSIYAGSRIPPSLRTVR